MTQELPDSEVATSASSSAPDTPAAPQDAAEEPRLLHITHAQQDEAWVRGAILPALGLQEGQYWTRAEDEPGAPRLLELERAVRSCRYTLLVASGAARVDEWTTFAGLIAQHLGIEEGKPRLLVVTRDFAPTSEEAHELLPLRQRALVCLDGSDPERLKAALAKLAAQLALTVTAAETPAECPYPGLRMFGAGDPASCFDRPELFFGRDEEAKQLVAHVRDRGRVLLVGPSGCGKSSLMRARVLPKLAEEMAIEIVRPDDDPDAALRAGLAKISPRLGEVVERCVVAEDPAVALEAALSALPALSEAVVAEDGGTRSLLLYVDQFEEVFRDDADSKGRRAAFFKRLALLGKVPHLAILLGMRADFYAHLMRSPVWDEFKDHRVELAPLRGAGLRHAIVRPAARAGVHVEADLVERLVREAELDRAAEALPLLQVALEQLWAQREWRYLSLASYAKLAHGEQRGLDAVLARHADASIAAMAEPRQVLARRVLLDLVHLGEGRPDTRRRRSLRELEKAGDQQISLAEVVQHLSQRRLIAMSAEVPHVAEGASAEADPTATADASEAAGQSRTTRHIDLAHDTLITGWPALSGWVSERRDEIRAMRRLEARAASRSLLAASELPEFLRWVAWAETPAGQVLGASKELRDLVKRSVAARTRRRWAWGIGFVAASTFAVIFGLQTVKLRDERTKTKRSISKAAETAELVVFEVDSKLRKLAGASGVRDSLLRSSHRLLADLRELGDLGEKGRTGTANQLAQVTLALERGQVVAARALSLAALPEAEARAKSEPANALWQDDLSIVYAKLGEVAMSVGDLPAARSWYEKQLAIHQLLSAQPTDNRQWQRSLSVSYNNLGDVAAEAGQIAVARDWYQRALLIREQLSKQDDKSLARLRDLSVSYERMGNVAMRMGELAIAHGWYSRGRTACQSLVEQEEGNAEWQLALSGAYGRLSEVALSSGDLLEARRWSEQGLAIARKLANSDETNAGWQREVSAYYDKLGEVAAKAGELAATRGWYEQGLAIDEKLARQDPQNAIAQRECGISYLRLGDLEMQRGDPMAARRWYERRLEIAAALNALDGANAQWQRDLSIAQGKLGDVALALKEHEDARRRYEQSKSIAEQLVQRDEANLELRRDLSISFYKLGNLEVSAGQLAAGKRWYELCWEIRRYLVAQCTENAEWQHDLAIALERLGDVELQMGNPKAALDWYEQGVKVQQPLVAKDETNLEWQQNLSASYDRLGDVAFESNDLEVARRWYEQGFALQEKLTKRPEAHIEWQRDLSISYNKLGDVALRSKDFEGAVARYLEGLAIRRNLVKQDPDHMGWLRDLATSFDRLGDAELEMQQPSTAQLWYEQGVVIAEKVVSRDGSPRARYDLLLFHVKLAAMLSARPRKAAPHAQRATEIYEQLRGSGAFADDAQFARVGELLRELRGED